MAGSTKLRRFGAISFVGVALAVPALFALSALGTYLSCERAGNPRLPHADQLVANRRLIGLDGDQINELLGPASNGKTFAGWDRTYWWKPDGMCVDNLWLVLRFGPDGRVEEARITND